MALDKTGTLTTGHDDRCTTSPPPRTPTSDEVLRLAGAVEDASEHPVGQAIARAAAARLGALPAVTDFTALPGAGVRGTVEDREVIVGRPGVPARAGLTVRPPCAGRPPRPPRRGPDRSAGRLGRAGPRRARGRATSSGRGSAEAVARIGSWAIRPSWSPATARHAARSVADRARHPGPSGSSAGVKPEGKVEAIRELQAGGTAVALVGDGVNDAAALAQADLGMAVGTGTDAAIGAADLTLVGGDPLGIADRPRAGPGHHGVIRANLVWAFGYNVVAIPLAALGYLNPLFAGIAMSASSLLVVGQQPAAAPLPATAFGSATAFGPAARAGRLAGWPGRRRARSSAPPR